MKSPIVVALDGLDRAAALALAEHIGERVWGFKLHALALREGIPDLLRDFKAHGNVFLDLKFHDIPEKVRQEVAAMTEFGADLVTVHASGGEAMLRAAVEAGGERVVAVTALTSLSPEDTGMIYHATPDAVAQSLAGIAARAGVANIVCSPHELATVRKAAPGARAITPGIRGPNDEKHDQKRTMSAGEAIRAGAGLLVIGRPITEATDPRSALEAIVASLA